MSDQFYFNFYPKDWIGDPAVTSCQPATRAVWIDFLCAMHQGGRTGILTGTVDQLAALGRCSAPVVAQALTDLSTTGTADVTKRHGVFTVVCRRMHREYKQRVAARERKRRQRNHEDVTPLTDRIQNSNIQQQSRRPAPPAAAAAKRILEEGGVGEPSLSRICGMPGMTAVAALLLVEQARKSKPKNLPGLIVSMAGNGYVPARKVPPGEFCRLVRTKVISSLRNRPISTAKYNNSGVYVTFGDTGETVVIKADELDASDVEVLR